MEIMLFLIVFPLLAGILIFVIPFPVFRNGLLRLAVLAIAGVSVYLAVFFFGSKAVFFPFESELINWTMFVIEFLLAVYIFIIGIRNKKYLVSAFVLLQFGLLAFFEIAFGHSLKVENNLFIDQFSIIMALIIGVIGSLICLYSIGYMKDFHHHHKEMKDQRGFFFMILLVFLSAMFGLVFSNNLLWLFFFWEITTICSFLLIGYTRTKEAVNNAFLALVMNLGGGLAFAIGIVFLYMTTGIVEMDKLLVSKQAFILLPAALFCFAGITKSAQLPFSKWLLGAMVAPTPTSALLHSSTMVKAGVYLVLRMSPILQNTFTGYMVALVGAVTFVAASCMAVSQRNAKRLLAYSTVANLGLIIACAGIGTTQTVWAGVFLIIFHAAAKSLLFLGVGTIEHKIGSRDIEDMDNLIVRMPKLALMMVIGICGMFIAPFGMLISKWAALEAFINLNSIMSPILIILLSFGSAVTVLFWTKWLGKIISVGKEKPSKSVEKTVSRDEWLSEGAHALLTVGICFAFPLISKFFVEPYINVIPGHPLNMDKGNFTIMLIMVSMITLLPLVLLLWQKSRKYKYSDPYMSSRTTTGETKFNASMGTQMEMTTKNYYLEKYFGEGKLFPIGVIVSSLLLIAMLGGIFL
jgi:ech hydrogenase subunit A